MKKTIGIVGGIGPYAGLDLNKKVFDNTKTFGKDQDYLDVHLISRPSAIGDRTAFLEGKEKNNPAFGIFRSILLLERLGANVIALPCNTAHSPKIFNKIEELLEASSSELELLHIVKECHKYLEQNFKKGEKIGLLATKGTYNTNLYKDIFDKNGIFTLIYPKEEGQNASHDAIYNLEYGVKAKSNITQKARDIFENEINKLEKDGVSAVILGCTEIPLAFEGRKKYGNVALIDASDILARALVAKVDKKYLK